jgi:hypothetical protein
LLVARGLVGTRRTAKRRFDAAARRARIAEDEDEPREDDDREDGAGDDQKRGNRGEAHGRCRLLEDGSDSVTEYIP